MRRLTMMNSCGHVTIMWEPEADEQMTGIIQKKMDAGVVFYTLEPVAGGLAAPRRTKLAAADRAAADGRRALAIDDADLEALVSSGQAVAEFGGSAPVAKGKAKKAKTAKEVIKAPAAVAVKQRVGG